MAVGAGLRAERGRGRGARARARSVGAVRGRGAERGWVSAGTDSRGNTH